MSTPQSRALLRAECEKRMADPDTETQAMVIWAGVLLDLIDEIGSTTRLETYLREGQLADSCASCSAFMTLIDAYRCGDCKKRYCESCAKGHFGSQDESRESLRSTITRLEQERDRRCDLFQNPYGLACSPDMREENGGEAMVLVCGRHDLEERAETFRKALSWYADDLNCTDPQTARIALGRSK